MNTELQMLVLSSLLTVVLALLALLPAALSRGGLLWALGNRDQEGSRPAWGQRAVRAHHNMLENLPPFAALVLAAQVAGISNETTAWGTTLFFWGRVAHAGIYVAGIPYLRTVAFLVAIGGMLDVARELIGAWSAGA